MADWDGCEVSLTAQLQAAGMGLLIAVRPCFQPLIAAVHAAGLVSLTHTPSPMGFLCDILERPKDIERPFMLLVVGYPAADASVPDIQRRPLGEIATFLPP